MQAKKRYILVCTCGILGLLLYFALLRSQHNGGELSNSRRDDTGRRSAGGDTEEPRPSYSFVSPEDLGFVDDIHVSPKHRRLAPSASDKRLCRMETCFDFTLCRGVFKVYVYPRTTAVSATYNKILTSIQESRHYTNNPHEACLFVPSVDTLDQDVLSADYVRDVQTQLRNLPYWNNGRNHIVFNLYSGTWPAYVETLGFDIGEAILAKASFSVKHFRPGFDISFPLFNKDHPQKGGEPGYLHSASNNIPSARKYLLSFKGKRYLTGIGSETRNSLYHIQNGKDILLLTTCKHGKGWQKKMDERCAKDNADYDKFDYRKLLYNSTFCLVPRGRRLGSFRFLEALQAACVPVLLSNGWELPFSEVINWNQAAIWGDERLLLQVPTMVRSVSQEAVLAYRQQNQFLWETYFASVDRIIHTVLEVVRDRTAGRLSHNSLTWNQVPGALSVLHEFSQQSRDFPFFLRQLGTRPAPNFTAVVYATSPISSPSPPLFRLLRNIARSRYAKKIVVLWRCSYPPPPSHKWPSDLGVPVRVRTRDIKTISVRFYPYPEIDTDAVFALDEDALLTTDEINFAYNVWREFPERIVGYPARNHAWDDARGRWSYTSRHSNFFSMVLTGAAIYHRYYNHLYTHYASSVLVQAVDQADNCEDILLNFLVAHVTRRPPIKVTQRRAHREQQLQATSMAAQLQAAGVGAAAVNASSLQAAGAALLEADRSFAQRHTCINMFVNVFGYMPLLRSQTRMDPLLFKDPVSNFRKKYKQIEMVTV